MEVSEGLKDVMLIGCWILLSMMSISAAYLRDQIRELEPLRARLVVVSEQCEKRILGLREEERVEISALKQERQHCQKVIENMRETQSALQTQVQCLPTRFSLNHTSAALKTPNSNYSGSY